MLKPVIEIDRVGKRYRIGADRERYLSLREELSKCFSLARRKAQAAQAEFWALKDVSFSVHEGEAIGIIGRNGAGKSTLLKILSRITPPTEGRITVRGRVASLLEVGTGFHLELTGRENIYLNGAILGMTRREVARKFDEIVEFSEVHEFLDTPVKRYSSGMFVRLAFAVAANLDPEILVVDEVLAVGDVDFQRKCIGGMERTTKGGRTVIFVSHNLALIEHLCSRAVLLQDGRIAGIGPTPDVVRAYLEAISSAPTGEASAAGREPAAHGTRVTGVRVRGADTSTDLMMMGQDIVIDVDVFAESEIKRPWMAVRLFSATDVLLFHCANREAGRDLPPLLGACTVRCVLRGVNLLPGRYRVDIDLADALNRSYDELRSAAFFTIVARDVLGSGLPMERGYGTVYYASEWSAQRHA